MSKSILYLFIGYPGAGKTTAAKLIHDKTGAVHIWADLERHKMFNQPTHSHEESMQLYDHLNRLAEDLLATGHSVIFDTNFNFYGDRQKLREIAQRHDAETVLVWITTPKAIAENRSVHTIDTRNGYSVSMNEQQFNTITAKLEPPKENEKVIKIDGSELESQELMQKLGLKEQDKNS